MRILILLASLVALLCVASLTAQPNGEQIYKTQCATCHDNGTQRAPDPAALKQRTPEQVVLTLTSGTMAVQGAALNDAAKRAVAEYVTGKKFGAAPISDASGGMCANAGAPLPDPKSKPMWNGWGPTIEGSHFQDAKNAGLTAQQVSKMKLKWAFGFPNGTSAFAQPSVVSGRLFVGSDKGNVYSLDAATGCTHWKFAASAGVRTAISVGELKSGPAKYAAYFGDLQANVYAVDAATGRQLWKEKVDDHFLARITGAPVLYGERLYVPVSSVEEVAGARAPYECCKFRGSLVALDTATGKQIWKSFTIPEDNKPTKKTTAGGQLYGPAGAAVWAAATLDLKAKAVYVGTGNAYTDPAAPTSDSVIAFDMETGKMLWSKQAFPADAFVIGCNKSNENCPGEVGPDYDFGTAPVLRTLPGGKRVLVAGQKSGVGWGLDPDNKGAILWQYRAGKGGALGGIEWGFTVDDQNAYFPISDRTVPSSAGGLHAVNLKTGERVWYAPPAKLECAGGPGCNAAQSAAISAIPGVVFSGSVDGHFRAYSTKDGSVIFDFDAAKDFDTVNQVKAKGGSFDAAGVAIADGMVYTTSGYGQWGGKAGNVLLAFAP